MAKKTTSKGKASKSKTTGLQDKRVRISIGVFLIIFALILLLAFFSFLFTWKADQSITWANLFQSGDIKAENWSGRIGALFANLFMKNWFGIASFSIPFIVGLYGFKVLNIQLLHFGKTFRHTLIVTLWLSIFLAFVFGTDNNYLGSGPGGQHGVFMVQWLNKLIGSVATLFVLLIFLFVFLIFSFDGFLPFIKTLPEKLKAFRAKQAKKNTTGHEKNESKKTGQRCPAHPHRRSTTLHHRHGRRPYAFFD